MRWPCTATCNSDCRLPPRCPSGGVLCLFVHDVRPTRQADGSAAGVHWQRPTLQALQQLEALLDGGAA